MRKWLCLASCLLATSATAFTTARPEYTDAEHLYLELMKRCVCHFVYRDITYRNPWTPPTELELQSFSPSFEQTLTGLDSLDSLEKIMEDVVYNNVPGDFIETGVWRGGTTIFMRAFLKAHNITSRDIWVADSFQGLPAPNSDKYPQDLGLDLTGFKWLAVSQQEVQDNFARYGLLDHHVHFLKGWFSETLPQAPIKQLAIMRLDGDLYESTMDALVNLYDKLSVGGYVIIDDYGAVPACAQAVSDFRRAHAITSPIVALDWTIVYWKKEQ